jgi:hypothetical protein
VEAAGVEPVRTLLDSVSYRKHSPATTAQNAPNSRWRYVLSTRPDGERRIAAIEARSRLVGRDRGHEDQQYRGASGSGTNGWEVSGARPSEDTASRENPWGWVGNRTHPSLLLQRGYPARGADFRIGDRQGARMGRIFVSSPASACARSAVADACPWKKPVPGLARISHAGEMTTREPVENGIG